MRIELSNRSASSNPLLKLNFYCNLLCLAGTGDGPVSRPENSHPAHSRLCGYETLAARVR